MTTLESLRGLLAFTHAASAGSFAAAGRQLGLSASAVGKAVGRLEARVGARLIERTTRSLSLTREGELLFGRASRILEELRETEAAIGHARRAPRGRVKLSVPTALGRRVVVPALSSFVERYPEVSLDVRLDDRRVAIVEDGYDVVVRTGRLDNSSLVARTMRPHRFVTCAAPAYLAARGTPTSPAELAGHRTVRFRFPTTGRLEDWFFTGGRRLRLPADPLVFDDTEALAAAARAALGIVQVPDYLVADDLATGRLVAILPGQTASRGDLFVVWPPSRTNLPRVRAVVAFLTHLLR